ncbi:hypothetical protein RHSIM_Rhsim10G0066700 [Rhododendron simsii]|uniref:Uncharacterized protein n=1 Tax=Rhododendron simsii TaxID=118357 RepID=A0A834G9A9_RHOSS|nr:hypothetical protein RHSIM_Rhsim10G0066700 [Rhododendron simsii]
MQAPSRSANNVPEISPLSLITNSKLKLFNLHGFSNIEDRRKEIIEAPQFQETQQKRNLGTCIRIMFEVFVLVFKIVSIIAKSSLKELQEVQFVSLRFNNFFSTILDAIEPRRIKELRFWTSDDAQATNFRDIVHRLR